jgi:hypothetical protein
MRNSRTWATFITLFKKKQKKHAWPISNPKENHFAKKYAFILEEKLILYLENCKK